MGLSKDPKCLGRNQSALGLWHRQYVPMTQDGHQESETSPASGFKEVSSILNLKNAALFTRVAERVYVLSQTEKQGMAAQVHQRRQQLVGDQCSVCVRTSRCLLSHQMIDTGSDSTSHLWLGMLRYSSS